MTVLSASPNRRGNLANVTLILCGKNLRKGQWLEIRGGATICYAQWEDVESFCTESAGFVFGDQRPAPNVNHGTGIDVSPVIRDYLGLGSLGFVHCKLLRKLIYQLGLGQCTRGLKTQKTYPTDPARLRVREAFPTLISGHHHGMKSNGRNASEFRAMLQAAGYACVR